MMMLLRFLSILRFLRLVQRVAFIALLLCALGLVTGRLSLRTIEGFVSSVVTAFTPRSAPPPGATVGYYR